MTPCSFECSFLVGVGAGGLSVAPLFLAEIAPAHLKGPIGLHLTSSVSFLLLTSPTYRLFEPNGRRPWHHVHPNRWLWACYTQAVAPRPSCLFWPRYFPDYVLAFRLRESCVAPDERQEQRSGCHSRGALRWFAPTRRSVVLLLHCSR
jgi:hypothetical protein